VTVASLGQPLLAALSSFFPPSKPIASRPMPSYPPAAAVPALAAKILKIARYKDPSRFFGVGIGTDTGGFSSPPGPRTDVAEHPLRYPFKSYDGRITFTRQRTGRRTFDLNPDGVAQYGLIADLLADTQHGAGGRRALSLLFRSAEAYLETWQRAVSHR
jgi:hypothetical protein